MVFTSNENLFIAEQGDATDDEVNRIIKAASYGWPDIAGYCDHPDEEISCRDSLSIFPVKAWTPTIAPAGMDFFGHSSIPEWQNSL